MSGYNAESGISGVPYVKMAWGSDMLELSEQNV